MTTPTQTLLERAAGYFGDDVTWAMPDAVAGLLQIKNLHTVHSFRPDFLALQKMKAQVSPSWPEAKTSTIALNLPRQVEWACGLLAQALDRLPVDGTLLMIAPNDLGGKRYAKLLEEHFEISFAESKSHCRLVALSRPAALPPVVEEWRKGYAPQKAEGTNLLSLPGTFSHGRVDAGSLLLANHLPQLSGAVADFGAGWGYISHHLLQQSAPPARLDLYEADNHALDMARENLAPWKNITRFFWHDILSEKITATYDAIVMNPPFHDMRAASPDIGRAFIATAAAALKSGGKLWLVANTHLPYEDVLKEVFGGFEAVVRANGYKALVAQAK